jgi:hypothetical protein
MQDYPLTVGAIVRHETSVHADRQVRTRQPDGTVRVATFGEVVHGQRNRPTRYAMSA